MKISIKTVPFGSKICWTKKGQTHREDGPAVIYSDGWVAWYQHGLVHREDGPAIIDNGGNGYYYLNHKRYTEYEFIDIIKSLE